MQFTTIPLPYGGIKNKAVEFTLRSPEELEKADPKFALNIDAGLPVVRGERLSKGLAAYAAFRRKALAGTSGDQRALTAPELELFEVRLAPAADAASPEETVPVPDEPPPPLPTGAPTTPRPVAAPRRPQGAPLPPVPLAPRPVVLNAPTPPEPVPPVAVPVGRVPGAATPPPAALPAVPLPEQRVVTTAQASSMVGDFKAGERIYLTGDFVVTGVHGQRAGLRTRDSLRDAKADPTQPGTTAAFIVVDFPPGVPPPKRDSVISREADRGFEIRDVIRDRNGQITIVATDRRQ